MFPVQCQHNETFWQIIWEQRTLRPAAWREVKGLREYTTITTGRVLQWMFGYDQNQVYPGPPLWVTLKISVRLLFKCFAHLNLIKTQNLSLLSEMISVFSPDSASAGIKNHFIFLMYKVGGCQNKIPWWGISTHWGIIQNRAPFYHGF